MHSKSYGGAHRYNPLIWTLRLLESFLVHAAYHVAIVRHRMEFARARRRAISRVREGLK